VTKIQYDAVRKTYRFAVALDSFLEIQETCKHLIENKTEAWAPGYYAMAAGIATLYCRPFTDNDLIGKLNPNLVPQKFKELHANLFELRNKAFAHTDPSGQLPGFDKMTEVRLIFEGKSVVNFNSRAIFYPPLLPQIKELSGLLAKKAKELHDEAYDRVLKDLRFRKTDTGKSSSLMTKTMKARLWS